MQQDYISNGRPGRSLHSAFANGISLPLYAFASQRDSRSRCYESCKIATSTLTPFRTTRLTTAQESLARDPLSHIIED